MMYDELVKALRNCADPDKYCEDCGFFDKCYKNTEDFSIVEQAADAIEDLIVALTASNEVIAKSKQQWISVTERLPEDGKVVLIYSSENKCILFDWRSNDDWQCFGSATHWMPLPEPPKGGES